MEPGVRSSAGVLDQKEEMLRSLEDISRDDSQMLVCLQNTGEFDFSPFLVKKMGLPPCILKDAT
jgi:hypothetical protein